MTDQLPLLIAEPCVGDPVCEADDPLLLAAVERIKRGIREHGGRPDDPAFTKCQYDRVSGRVRLMFREFPDAISKGRRYTNTLREPDVRDALEAMAEALGA